VGQSGNAMPAPMLVTTPPHDMRKTVRITVHAENRRRQVQSEVREREGGMAVESPFTLR
jgi:hypothetical protein